MIFNDVASIAIYFPTVCILSFQLKLNELLQYDICFFYLFKINKSLITIYYYLRAIKEADIQSMCTRCSFLATYTSPLDSAAACLQYGFTNHILPPLSKCAG